MAELADAYGSGPYGRKSLRVQVPFRPFLFFGYLMMKTRTYYRPSTVSLGKKKRVVRHRTGARFLVKFFLFLFLCAIIAVGSWFLVTRGYRALNERQSSHWQAKEIILSGVKGPLHTQVMALLQPYQNKTFSKQDADELRKTLQHRFPMLSEINIKRAWWHPTLQVHAQHRTPLAKFMLPSGTVQYIDADRTIYEDAYAPASSPVPFIELEGEIPQKLSAEIIELIQSTIKLHQELDFAFLRINLTNNTVKMYMPNDCIIDFGPAIDLKQKAELAAKIITFSQGKYSVPFVLNFHFFDSGKVFLTQVAH